MFGADYSVYGSHLKVGKAWALYIYRGSTSSSTESVMFHHHISTQTLTFFVCVCNWRQHVILCLAMNLKLFFVSFHVYSSQWQWWLIYHMKFGTVGSRDGQTRTHRCRSRLLIFPLKWQLLLADFVSCSKLANIRRRVVICSLPVGAERLVNSTDKQINACILTPYLNSFWWPHTW